MISYLFFAAIPKMDLYFIVQASLQYFQHAFYFQAFFFADSTFVLSHVSQVYNWETL